jgi:phosphoglycerate dehydrogenase-like enzyme
MPTVCVPDSRTASALDDLRIEGSAGGPDELVVLVWEPGQPAPSGVEQVEFYVPGYAGRATPREDVGRMPALKVLQVLSAGVDVWLDRVPSGVTLCNGTGIHGVSTAELALAGILSHLRQLPRFAAAQHSGVWHREFTASLRDRRVLVLGAGDIGARVAAVARLLEADVTVIARQPRAGVRTMTDVPQLLPSAQVVVVALPSTPETTKLVDADFLAALPDGALVVNIARGAIIDEPALLAELTARRLYAFLDVFETEPLPAGDPFWQAPNVVFTPHIGGGTEGWQRAALQLVHDQIGRYLRGEPLVNVVTDGY